MSVPIIVAVIAAVASLVATIVAFVTARQARKVAFNQEQFKLLLKLSEERIARLRTLSAATERLRARGMLLRSELETALLDVADWSRISLIAAWTNEYHEFWMRWPDVKDDVPDADLEALRSIRHNMRHQFDQLSSKLALIETRGSRPNRQEYLEIDQRMANLLLKLDSFYGEIAHLRSDAIEKVILSEPTASGSLTVRSTKGPILHALSRIIPSREKFTPSS